ncbi:hypothetical protein K435DRAFT_177076 [Dendrothele bispora CBS 962.96]|uniref:Uncharacterized protein n=1 Tax=Dendrothele bispora (strain CBS 962.96) TaxID=1314807 RepID=A0A4S8MZ54_DENBC|nr:hypothetical protein K435DRAFT_177076 [Dendrothele bispora CBS 962.96]
MMSPNDSSGVEIVDLPESTNSPSESDTGNQPLSTSSLLDAQFQAPHELRSVCPYVNEPSQSSLSNGTLMQDVVHRTTALVLKDAPDDMLVSKSGPEPELEPESALAPSEPLVVANEHEFPSITPTRKEMEEIPDSELSQINQTNAVLSPVPTTTNASESTTAPLVQMKMGEHPGTESSQTAQMDGECADAEAVVPPPEPVPRGSASAEPAFVANGTEPAMVSQIEMEVENEAEDGHNSKDLEVEPPQTAHNASTGALNTVSQIVIPPPEPVPREPIKLETSSQLRKAQSARFEFHKAIDEGRREVKPEEIIVPSFGKIVYSLLQIFWCFTQRY